MTATPVQPAPRPASLTQWLRARTDAELAQLLARRPDLALPAPPDLPSLANRLSVRSSVQRAVDGLDAFVLRVLEAIVLTATTDRPIAFAEAVDLLGDVDPGDLDRALSELLDLSLVWGDAAHLELVTSVRESVGSYPAGLGRPARTLLRRDLTDVDGLLERCTPEELQLLQRLAGGPPVGTVRNGQPPAAFTLVGRGLLALREVPLGPAQPQPPVVEVVERDAADLDRLGTTAVLDTLRIVDSLADLWTAHAPAQLRSGGVGVRDMRRTAKDLGIGEDVTALVAEVASAAGLFNVTTGFDPAYLPTEQFDGWRRRDTATRWCDLALAWLNMTRQPSLVGARGDRDRVIALLSPDVERGTTPALRRQVLGVLAALPPGHAPRDHDQVLARLAWHAPRRATGHRPIAAAILAEADLLGITAAGGLTGYSRTLIDGSRTVAEQVLSGALPAPVDHFLVQPDLTIVVPGPPTPNLAAELALAAELESTGGASVYRVTEASVRRALDAGRSGLDIAAMIAQRSRTPVPQALQYLIDDLARRHGTLRSGAAGAYLRCEDEALLSRAVSDRNNAALGLRQIAPTVVVTTEPVGRVLEVLRESGYAPAAESPDGQVISLGAELPRAPSRPATRIVRSRAETGNLGELVKRVRSGDALTEISRRASPLANQIPGVTSAATMGLLREAIRQERRVLLGVAESDGTAARHVLAPISMAGGFVRGTQDGRTELVSFPLHRITAATLFDDEV